MIKVIVTVVKLEALCREVGVAASHNFKSHIVTEKRAIFFFD